MLSKSIYKRISFKNCPEENEVLDLTEDPLLKVTYGIYVVSSRKGKKYNGLIINTATQVTPSPPCVSVFISRMSLTHEYIMESKVFSITILKKETPVKFIGKWGFKSGREIDKFEGTQYKIGASGAPIVLDNAVGYIDMRMIEHFTVGTHTIFIGEVVSSEILSDEEPMTYAYYRDVKGGRSSKYAPTYDGWGGKGKDELARDLGRHVCGKCGFVYDPVSGDAGHGIAPGMPFSKLPPDWRCPLCGSGKNGFIEAKL